MGQGAWLVKAPLQKNTPLAFATQSASVDAVSKQSEIYYYLQENSPYDVHFY
jgi:hypothetical protein